MDSIPELRKLECIFKLIFFALDDFGCSLRCLIVKILDIEVREKMKIVYKS